ncbi:conserved protein of unknown function [Streptomyces sp. KY75]|nr:hypothetical protein STIB_02140 [Streptomyces sp. IB2014 011-1]RDV53100.1 hypothetical protein DDV98_05480 [Streptomyces sp. IB2014 011-12]CAD5963633.1 conserved protein of unknown function [Streptomyces sp. KY70]CAD5978864.1 conserved protein of unknown function [Streptomyces sp. KY75]
MTGEGLRSEGLTGEGRTGDGLTGAGRAGEGLTSDGLTGDARERWTPEPGSFAVDGRDGRVGRVMGRAGDDVRLRPPGGGPEWSCPPDVLRPAPPGVALRARVTEINREGQLPR